VRRYGEWRSNKSNALHLALLLKYGGFFVDLDVVSISPLIGTKSSIPSNSLGIQKQSGCDHAQFLSNTILRFDAGSIFIAKAIGLFLSSYSSESSDGHGLVTAAAKEVGSKVNTRIDAESGYSVADNEILHVLPRSRFYGNKVVFSSTNDPAFVEMQRQKVPTQHLSPAHIGGSSCSSLRIGIEAGSQRHSTANIISKK
jgi:hypothetical protein